MSTDINIHLSPETFTALQQAALAAGRSPSEEAAAALEQKFRSAAIPARANDNDASDAGPSIEDFFGKISFGGSMTNEQIDAELAREYGKGLEGY